MGNTYFEVIFRCVDGDTETYQYQTMAAAEEHAAAFYEDDSGLYDRIDVVQLDYDRDLREWSETVLETVVPGM